MSYQLIYHAPATECRPPTNGVVAARSRTIPRPLEQALAELSPELCPGSANSEERQFSYMLTECDGATFHVLSSLYSAPSQGYTAHHLALTYDEVQALRRNASRPTPAGLMQALDTIGLWCTTTARQRFPYIDDEPRLTAAALPEAGGQLTWERLTGQKNNARCFFTSPYDRNCLVAVPANLSVQDILMLIHESDWLSSTRGWGKTFITQASAATRLPCNRIVLPPGSTATPAGEPDRPLLTIDEQLAANFYQATPSTEQPRPLRATPHGATANDTGRYLPYKFAETSDSEIYKVLPPPNKWLRRACYLAGAALLWAGVSLISGLVMDDAGELTGDIITQINTGEDALLLARLAAGNYSHESTVRHLDKFEARLRTLPATDDNSSRHILLECVNLLRSASKLSTGHADNLRQLTAYAATLRQSSDSLCRLYMHEATYNRPAENWLPAGDAAELATWQDLLTDHPGMLKWLAEPPFAPYLAPLNLPTPATVPQPTPNNGEPS